MEDFRYIDRGKPIPREQYTDQPYVVVADDGAWVCVLTTAYGQEGAAGTHVGITVSYDRGNTWTDLYFPEGDDLRESAYGVLLKTSFNRIYCFYNFNKNNLRNLICRKERLSHRVDMQGAFVFRYSDDSGKTWSERYEVP
ncbi:MAG TPA: sialidase family protein, partial [Clostridia bacterium]|nr:sialidase family protein [Clostridia bacterium]